MANQTSCDVLIINAPWSNLNSPSIQLSILKPIARQAGFECQVLYANLLFAKYVEPALYSKFQGDLSFVGEWLFSGHVFRRNSRSKTYSDLPNYYIAQYAGNRIQASSEPRRFGGPHQKEGKKKPLLEEKLGKNFRNVIEKLKDKAIPAYLRRMEKIFEDYAEARIVGFTSTFNQNLPSLALAKALKKRFEDKVVVLGGANCEDAMGPALMRAFPYIDYVVSGEAEETFPSLLKILFSRTNESITNLKGVSYRADGKVRTNPPADLVTNLDAYPNMDCDDYYRQLEEIQKEKDLVIEKGSIFFECSRGCWWGSHSHCTFCGLNDSTMSFRPKSPETIIRQLLELAKHHKVLSFEATDNILNPSYFIKLLPKLKAMELDLKLFFEVKANMTKKHVKVLSESGVNVVQPGIESLSTHVLQLMRKGTTMLQNIQALKWFEEYHIRPVWNLIGGFPGESEHDYLITEQRIPLLFHLPPPTNPEFNRFEMHRFSPIFKFAREFGFRNVRPKEAYRYVYDLDDDLLHDIAYAFAYELPGFEKFLQHIRNINTLLEEWHRKYYSGEVELSYGRGPEFIEVIDKRNGHEKRLTFDGYEMKVLLCCDGILTIDRIMSSLGKNGEPSPEGDVLASIERLEAQGLMLSEEGKYLALPIARNDFARDKACSS